jgi:hypothetical protein
MNCHPSLRKGSAANELPLGLTRICGPEQSGQTSQLQYAFCERPKLVTSSNVSPLGARIASSLVCALAAPLGILITLGAIALAQNKASIETLGMSPARQRVNAVASVRRKLPRL